MRITHATPLWLPAIILIFMVSNAHAQTAASVAQGEVATASTAASSGNRDTHANVPVFSDYRGVRIGMSADEVRAKLKNLKNGGPGQDFFVFSEKESAQIYYGKDKTVTAISVDYIGENSNAPSPNAVLGIDLQARPDGSIYQLQRYPEAGYWVSYNRTAGDKPIVTVTMQKI